MERAAAKTVWRVSSQNSFKGQTSDLIETWELYDQTKPVNMFR